jgi:hypothetical protein
MKARHPGNIVSEATRFQPSIPNNKIALEL